MPHPRGIDERKDERKDDAMGLAKRNEMKLAPDTSCELSAYFFCGVKVGALFDPRWAA